MSDALLKKALKLTWEISILKINATQAAQKHKNKNFPSFNSFSSKFISLCQRKLVACFESCQLINAEILLQTIAIAASQQIKLAAKTSFFRIGVQTTHFQLHILPLAYIYFLLANLYVLFSVNKSLSIMFYFLLANLYQLCFIFC